DGARSGGYPTRDRGAAGLSHAGCITRAIATSLPSFLGECSSKNWQNGAIFFAAELFLDRNQCFQIQDTHQNAVRDFHFGRMRQQVLISESTADRPQQNEGAVSRDQIQMARTGEVAGSWPGIVGVKKWRAARCSMHRTNAH